MEEKKKKPKMILVPELDYQFLISQNKSLITQNRLLQSALNELLKIRKPLIKRGWGINNSHKKKGENKNDKQKKMNN